MIGQVLLHAMQLVVESDSSIIHNYNCRRNTSECSDKRERNSACAFRVKVASCGETYF